MDLRVPFVYHLALLCKKLSEKKTLWLQKYLLLKIWNIVKSKNFNYACMSYRLLNGGRGVKLREQFILDFIVQLAD